MKVLILGAGPTGLGAAWRLEEVGHHDWTLVDAAMAPGGLASSVVDERGFTWDMGGHVLFSHYEYFDRLMDDLLGDAWVEHVRESWVFMRGRFIPYPLQNNIWRLPPEDLIPCLEGLLEVHAARAREEREPRAPPANFREWILRTFGRGLADAFLLPYNRKVWAYDPAVLGTQWMGERVATVDLPRVLRNLVLRQDDCGWGPNARFRFPLCGGTGAIWRALAARLPAERITLGRRVTAVDPERRTARLEGGESLSWDRLISTIPLDSLLRAIAGRPDLAARAGALRYSSTHVVGAGIDGPVPAALATKCWMYFPEPEVPFYRVTVFSNYSPHNVPEPGRQWSLMAEVAESPEKPVDAATVADECVAGLRRCGLLSRDANLLSLFYRRLNHGYPTPFVERDALLAEVDPALRALGIWSRGRFGAWKYEVSNQDHSLMQGVEAVDHILFGTEERTYRSPAAVNAGKERGLRPRPAARA